MVLLESSRSIFKPPPLGQQQEAPTTTGTADWWSQPT